MLEARGISFAYPGKDPLFDKLTLSLEPTERLAIQAPSGFGKSTLCRILAGYDCPSEGEIRVDGKALTSKGVSPVQLIWQHPESAVDPRIRIRKTLEEAGRIPEDLLERLGVRHNWLKRYPHELSGGELQRICIARAFMTRPRYLVADEISTMLDAVTQAQIWHFILEETKRCEIGLVFVSHSEALSERIATRSLDLTTLEQS